MKNEIRCALFIDDDKATNFVHKFIANKTNYFKKIEIVSSAKEGLEYLENAELGKKEVPNYIFLDINMPAMNGWDFLKNYEQKTFSIKENIKIFMLSSSSNTMDIDKAKEHKYLSGYIIKPLTESTLLGALKGKNVFELIKS